MLSSAIFTVLLAVSAGVSARMENQRRATAPASYAEGYLEKYDVYHTRYVAVGCKGKQGTAFFDKCCHPMLATETLAKNRPAECDPKNIKASKTSSSTPTPTPTPKVDDEGDECEEGEEDCVCEPEDDEEPSSSKAPATTHATSTKKTTSKPTGSSNTNNNNNNNNDSGAKKGGFATYFYQNGNAGACGKKNPDSAYIAAIYSSLYGASGSTSQHCGQKIKITNTNNGKSVTVTVADECPSCVNANSIDLSHAAFTAIATEADGMVPISWTWA